jgi:murein L,D-transpeptidase YcbB/YkuD
MRVLAGPAVRLVAFGALAFLTIAAAPAPDAAVPAAAANDAVATAIEHVLDVNPAVQTMAGETVDGAALTAFYRARHWAAAWHDQAAAVQSALAAAGDDGLASLPLHLKAIAARIDAPQPAKAAEGEMLLTDAVLRYAAAMRGQRVDPTDIEDDWFVATPGFDTVAFASKHVGDIVPALAGLAPQYNGYHALRDALIAMRKQLAVDWPKIPPGPTLRPGDTNDRIVAVRHRLIATGELAADNADSTTYDDTLKAAVMKFQARNGVDADGALGPRTLLALNASPAQRARTIALNMERWRWLPDQLESEHIVVNVPAEEMQLVSDNRVVLEMRAIVGDVDHPTPALHARLNSMVLNPIWRVPASIATDEILPQLQKNPGYLVANDLELVSDKFTPGSPESQGAGIAWKSMTRMPWPVRQRAGSDNALGRIKFNLPNDDDIYLHDTPKHQLFTRFDRALSHGCVRLENPDALALYLLKDKGWTQDQLDQAIGAGETKTIMVPKSVPVWLLYFTAWVDADGVLQFRDDLYDRDQRLAVALTQAMRQPVLLARAANPTITAKKICEGCRVP